MAQSRATRFGAAKQRARLGFLGSGIIYWLLLQSLTFVAKLQAEEYTVGVVPQFEVRQLHAAWQPLLDALTERTGHTFKLLGNGSIPEFEAAFKAGEFDFIYSNPWHAVIASEAQGYSPIVRDGARQLKGILVVAKNSGIGAVAELDGKEIAFPSPNALGASLLMRADLARIFDIDITPVYVDTHTSVYLNVVLGTTAAGGGVMRTLNEQAETISKQVKVIYQTRPMPPHPISVHPRVPEIVQQQVQQALLALGASPATNALFAAIPMQSPIATDRDEYLVLETWGLRDFYVSD